VRPLQIVNILLLAVLWAGSAMVWSSLPARVPMHFGLDGTPDRWAAPTFWEWFALPLIALGTTVLFLVLAWAVARRPGLVNIPDRERFLALPPAGRRPVTVKIQTLLHAIGAQTVLLMGSLQWSIYYASRGGNASPVILVLVGAEALLVPVLTFWTLGRIQNEIDRQSRAQSRV